MISRADRRSPGEATRPGRVVANYGRRLLVEDEAECRHQCVARGRRLRAVCGDRVRWRPPEGDGDGVVLEILARDTELKRPDSRGRLEVLAANISQLVVVIASRPPPDRYLADRYLAAAELMPCAGAVILNKSDLDTTEREPAGLLEEYRRIGYPVARTSAKTRAGLDRLEGLLSGHLSILVGQSGVGKSSLMNALLPDVELATAKLSEATGKGRHTTTASVMHRLASGGSIIDSPGVRDYAPPPVAARELARGFREFAAAARDCRFADCLHDKEPDCGVKASLSDGSISHRRYQSYRRLLHLMNSLAR